MINKKKVSPGFGTQATSNKRVRQNHSASSNLKVRIVGLEMWGMLPIALGEWLIHRWTVRHD